MKTIKFFAAAILTLGTLSSCKKEATPPPVDGSPKVSKIERVDGSKATNFTYNAQGRLTQVKDNSFTTNFDYTASSFTCTIYDPSGVKQYDYGTISMENGRVKTFSYRGFNPTGEILSDVPVTLQYDANGFQVQKSYEAYVFTAEVSGGNIIKSYKHNNGSLQRESSHEYYTDKPNKFNVNVFEADTFDNYIGDAGVFGKHNANLPKKTTTQSGSTTRTSEYSYVIDANGLVTEYTEIYSVNGVATPPVTYKVSWQ